jgi:hypothetical protein
MAEAVTEGVLQIGQNEENYLEFDLGEGHSERADPATNDIAADREQMNATATDDFDVQFDELDEGGDPAYFEPSHTVFGDVQNGKLGGPHDNRAVSEIDYNESEEEEEEEEEDKPDQPAADSTVSHGSVDNDNADGTTEFFGKDDEISYDDTDLEAIQTTTGALETRAAPGPEVDAGANEQEANVLDRSQQGNTVASDTYGDVPESEQHHVDDGQSPKACAAEEPVQEGNTPIDQSVENEHSGAHFDHGWSEDHQQTAHGVIATYKGREYELFASPTNSDPETYFFASTEELYCPLSQMFHGIRDILGAELHPTDELLLAVEDLDLVIGSVSLSGTGDSKADANILQSSNEEFLEETTMHDILNLYLQLQLNDGVTDEPTLFVQLMARPPCEERFRFLKNAAQEGRGLTEFYDSPADSDMDIDMDLASGHHSDEESVGDAVTSADELGDKGNGDVADMEDVQEAFSLYGTNGIDEHAEEGEDLLEGDLEADITSVPEHPNGKGPSIDDGDVAEASPEEGGQASNQAEEAPADQYFNGGNEQGDVTDDGDNHDSANEPGASTAVRQGSDLDLAGAMEPSDENGQDEAGEGLEDGVERVGSGDVASDSFTAGNYPIPVHSPAESPAVTLERMLDAYLASEHDEIPDGLWENLYVSPTIEPSSCAGGHEEDLIDYSNNEGEKEVHDSVSASCDGLQQTVASEPGTDLDGCFGDEEMSFDVSGSCHDAATFPNVDVRTAQEGHIGYSDQDDDKFVSSASPSVRASTAQQNKTRQPATYPMLADSPTLPVPAHQPVLFAFAAHRSFQLLDDTSTPNTTSAQRANLSGLQVEADGDIRQEAGIDVEYSSAVATLDEEVAHDDALDDDGEVDYLLTNDDVPNDDLAAADDFGQVTDSKTTSNTSTLQGDVDEIDYNEDAAHADELDLHLDAVNDAPANDVDEIDWNHDGDEGDANGDLSTTNNTSPESSAKRFRDADDGSSLDAENGTYFAFLFALSSPRKTSLLTSYIGTPAKRQKL